MNTKQQYDTPSTDSHCSMTSFCSLDSLDTTYTLSSCFRTNNNGRKRARRVFFAKEIESVHIIENYRLTLSRSEKQMLWEMPDEDDFLEQALFHCFCEPEKKSKNDNNIKRQRSKSRSTTEKKQQQLLFADMLSSPSQKRRPSELKKSSKKAESKSPLKCIKAKLGLPKQ